MTLVVLTEIGEAISANLPLDDVLNRIVSALNRLVPQCDAVSIALLDARRENITIRASALGNGDSGVSRTGWHSSISQLPTVQTLLRTGTLLYIPDTRLSPLWKPSIFPGDQARSFIGVPLLSQQSVVGLLFIDLLKADPLTEDMRYIVLAFARYAATAINSAQQQENLRRSEERYRVAASLTSNAIYERSGDQMIWSGDIDHLLRYAPGEGPSTVIAWRESIHPDDRMLVDAAFQSALERNTPFEAEYRVRRADGTYCHVLDRAVTMEQTLPPTLLGAISDLTSTYDLTDALINSEVRYRTIFTTALDAIFIVDEKGIILDANPAAEAMMGREFSKLLSKHFSSLALPEEEIVFKEVFEALREHDTFRNRQLRIQRIDGTAVHVEMWGTPLGHGIYQLVAHDISAQMRAQALAAQRTAELIALNELTRATSSGGNLRDMLRRALPGAMSVLEVPVGVIYLRDGQAQSLRLAAKALGPGTDHTEPAPWIEELFPETMPLNTVYQGRATDLSVFVRIVDQAAPSNMQVSALQVPLLSEGTVAGLVIFAETRPRTFLASDIRLMDIVGRQLEVGIENVHLLNDLGRRVEDRTSALLATQMRYKSLIEQVPGIVYTGGSVFCELTFLSSGTDDLVGVSPAEIQTNATGLLMLVSSEDQPWVLELAEIVEKSGEDFDAQYRLINQRTNDERWVHHRARRISDGTGDAFWLGLLTDVSKLKELDTLKSQFVATVSHELRTPLSAIKLRAATLQIYYDRLSDRERLEMVERITYQADILADLIEDVLRLARLDEGNVERVIEQVNMTDVGVDVVEELLPTATNAGLKLNASWIDPRCMINADITDVARIWRNLISNAIKYTEGPGFVNVYGGYATISLAHEVSRTQLPPDLVIMPSGLTAGEWAVGIVQDTGRGITDFDQQHIFARFFRGEAALTSIPGTGLGLSLVSELLQNYGGAIALRSQPGQGSTFAFWLPVSAEPVTGQ